MSNALSLVVLIIVSMVCVASGFRTAFARPLIVTKMEMGNKMDGIPIDGELMPITNNVLVRVKDIASETKGGLFIPDNAKERPTEGTISSHGPGRYHSETGVLLPVTVKVGDKVIYGKFDGSELKYNDVCFQLIKDDDILITYTGDEPTVESCTPVKDQVMIRLPPKEDKSLTGIILSTAEEGKKICYGIVEKVGPGKPAANGELLPMHVVPGDGVRFRDFATTMVKLEGQEFLMVKAYDIMAKW